MQFRSAAFEAGDREHPRIADSRRPGCHKLAKQLHNNHLNLLRLPYDLKFTLYTYRVNNAKRQISEWQRDYNASSAVFGICIASQNDFPSALLN
jgi:hypothetical protein